MARTQSGAFGAWLRDRLRARGWYVADFAARVGVRPPTVYQWLAGRRAPAEDMVARIAEILALDPAAVWAVLTRDGIAPLGAAGRPRPILPSSGSSPPADRPFARWLRSALAGRRWTPGRLARALDVEYATVLRWTGGLQTPASVQVAGLAAALGVDAATVRGAIEGPRPSTP